MRPLGRLGWPLRCIEEATEVRVERPSALPQGRWNRGAWSAQEAIGCEFKSGQCGDHRPGGGGEVTPQTKSSKCEPYRDLIQEAMAVGHNAKAIWQDLQTDHGFDSSHESVKRFVRKENSTGVRQAHPTITTEPGAEGQVDHGTGPMVRHPKTGKSRCTRLFAFTLGFGRMSIWLLAWKSGSKEWSELHEEAFRRLGGVSRVVVLDNLKEGVVKPDIYDPELNPVYRNMLTHYGATALPARVRHPDRKGKVESAAGHAQGTPLKGKRFETLEEVQAYLDAWAEKWAGLRIHGTMKHQVSTMLEEERPFLMALPMEPLRYFEFGHRTVHLGGCSG
ncbi:MAG: IS21 family transposase [bacterium]|nr:IS21 family transposase [bacterium]